MFLIVRLGTTISPVGCDMEPPWNSRVEEGTQSRDFACRDSQVRQGLRALDAGAVILIYRLGDERMKLGYDFAPSFAKAALTLGMIWRCSCGSAFSRNFL